MLQRLIGFAFFFIWEHHIKLMEIEAYDEFYYVLNTHNFIILIL